MYSNNLERNKAVLSASTSLQLLLEKKRKNILIQKNREKLRFLTRNINEIVSKGTKIKHCGISLTVRK